VRSHKAPFLLVRLPAVDQSFYDLLHFPLGIQARLEVIGVELDPERLQVRILLGAQIGDRKLADRLEIVFVALIGKVVAGDVLDVFAVVTLLRPAGLAWLDSFARARTESASFSIWLPASL